MASSPLSAAIDTMDGQALDASGPSRAEGASRPEQATGGLSLSRPAARSCEAAVSRPKDVASVVA